MESEEYNDYQFQQFLTLDRNQQFMSSIREYVINKNTTEDQYLMLLHNKANIILKIEYEFRKLEAKNFILTQHLKKEKTDLEVREKAIFKQE